jgi:hypothetical protein
MRKFTKRELFVAAAGLAAVGGWSVVLYNRSLPILPVAVSFRASMVGEGLVAMFHNTSGRYLAIRVVFDNRTLNAHNVRSLSMNPGEVVEVGWSEGWTFRSSETITASHQDYQTVSWLVP